MPSGTPSTPSVNFFAFAAFALASTFDGPIPQGSPGTRPSLNHGLAIHEVKDPKICRRALRGRKRIKFAGADAQAHFFPGSGKLCIDGDSFKYEIVK